MPTVVGTAAAASLARPTATTEDTLLEALVLAFIVIGVIGVGYYGSLLLNPWVRCSKCHGNPRREGWLFRRAHHICPKCRGTGQQLRLGRRLLNMGPPEP